MPLFVVTFWFLHPAGTTLVPYVGLLITLGLIAHVLTSALVLPSMIRGREEDNLVMAFRTSFFLGIGVSEVVALVAIVCTFISAPLGIIVLGAVITLSGFARIAPTQRLFRWCDGRLQAKGKPIRMTGRGVACSPIPRRPLLCEIPRRRLDVPQ